MYLSDDTRNACGYARRESVFVGRYAFAKHPISHSFVFWVSVCLFVCVCVMGRHSNVLGQQRDYDRPKRNRRVRACRAAEGRKKHAQSKSATLLIHARLAWCAHASSVQKDAKARACVLVCGVKGHTHSQTHARAPQRNEDTSHRRIVVSCGQTLEEGGALGLVNRDNKSFAIYSICFYCRFVYTYIFNAQSTVTHCDNMESSRLPERNAEASRFPESVSASVCVLCVCGVFCFSQHSVNSAPESVPHLDVRRSVLSIQRPL